MSDPYSPSFGPAYREGDTIKAHHSGTTDHLRIVAVRFTGVHEHDWGALVANTLANHECTHLQLPAGQIGQYRIVIMQPFWLFMRHPSSSRYWTTKTYADSQGAMWGINYWEADRSLAPVLQEANFIGSQFWVWEDDSPTFDVLPFKSVTPQGYVHFMGYRYVVEALPEGIEGHSDLWIDAWPGGG